MSSGHSAVADFYRNKNLFITGGTGFLGLGLIEKALRSLDVSGENPKTDSATMLT